MSSVPAVAAQFLHRLPASRTKVRIGRVTMAGLSLVGVDPVRPVRLLDGTVVILDMRGRTEGGAAFNGTYESRELLILKACTPRGGVLLDIGANVGLLAVPLAVHMAPAGGRVVAIEPVPANLRRLVDSARLNQVEIETHAVALGDHEGSIAVTRERGLGATTGNAIVGEVGMGRGETTIAPLTTLDRLAKDNSWGPVDTIKVDIEGYELAFMVGAEEMLTRDRPVVVGEFNSDLMPKFGHDFVEVGDICVRLGYRIVQLDEDMRPVEVEAVVGRGNVVLVPEERMASLMRTFAGLSGGGDDGALEEAAPLPATNPVTTLAFYLPQFHPVPENDQWWGKGFTEWTNTAKARPLYPGHYQPHIPADLGFYDLRCPESREAQAELARRFGVSAFLYWHYWFAGRRMLDRPFREVLESGAPDFPFCLAWANQTWTGIWHGAADRILVEQTYPGPDDDQAHFDALLPAFRDHRYLTVRGKPLFYVFRPEELPDAAAFVDRWQTMARAAGFDGLYLVAEVSDLHGTRPAYRTPHADGFDAGAYMRVPGHRSRGSVLRMRALRKVAGPEVLPYATRALPIPTLEPGGRLLPTVYPNWDNTPRSGRMGLVLHSSTPKRFRVHVRAALDHLATVPPDDRLLFVKSWNEWAEGNHLEPDLRFGTGHLEALRDELTADATVTAPAARRVR